MRAYIHAFQGRSWNEDCMAAFRGFMELGVECILFSNNEQLEGRTTEDIVVGGMLIVSAALNELGIYPESIDYPEELTSFCKRNIREIALKELINESFPCFVKPVREKIAKGKVVYTNKDLREYDSLSGDEVFYCSEVKNFVSEWRCFVCDGDIVGVKCYNGDEKQRCNIEVVRLAVNSYKKIPRGCSLDFGVTETGDTVLIEVNDGFALGYYGLDDKLYAKLLLARWQELVGENNR